MFPISGCGIVVQALNLSEQWSPWMNVVQKWMWNRGKSLNLCSRGTVAAMARVLAARCLRFYSPRACDSIFKAMEKTPALFSASPLLHELTNPSRYYSFGAAEESEELDQWVGPPDRRVEGRVLWEAPIKLLYDMLHEKGFIDRKRKPAPLDPLIGQDDHRIVAWYQSVGVGILEYYQFCDNISKVRSIVNYQLRWSAIYTLAKKHKSSSSQIIQRCTKNLVIMKDGVRSASFLSPIEISEFRRCFLSTNPVPPELLIDMLYARLIRSKALVEHCAVKGCVETNVEMLHVHQLEKAGGKHKVRSSREVKILEGIKAIRSTLNRNHIPLCAHHHDELDEGKIYMTDLDLNALI